MLTNRSRRQQGRPAAWGLIDDGFVGHSWLFCWPSPVHLPPVRSSAGQRCAVARDNCQVRGRFPEQTLHLLSPGGRSSGYSIDYLFNREPSGSRRVTVSWDGKRKSATHTKFLSGTLA